MVLLQGCTANSSAVSPLGPLLGGLDEDAAVLHRGVRRRLAPQLFGRRADDTCLVGAIGEQIGVIADAININVWVCLLGTREE